MISLFKKIFGGRRKQYYSLQQEPDLRHAFRFSKVDLEVREVLKQFVSKIQNVDTFAVEGALNGKKVLKFNKEEDLIDTIISDIEINFEEYNKEFLDEPDLSFEYYIGNSLLFSNSTEVLQRIYRKDGEVGDMYYGLVIKHNKDGYFYWKW